MVGIIIYRSSPYLIRGDLLALAVSERLFVCLWLTGAEIPKKAMFLFKINN